MVKTVCKIWIGTSGWYYNHWQGRFYPDDLPKSDWLAYYAKQFDTVEINNTFYHLPQEQTLKNCGKLPPKISCSQSRQTAISPISKNSKIQEMNYSGSSKESSF